MALQSELAGVEKILVLNRIDIPEVAESSDELKAYADERGLPFFAISAVTGAGVSALINYLGESIVRSRQGDDPSA